jgi:hypothetical protein
MAVEPLRALGRFHISEGPAVQHDGAGGPTSPGLDGASRLELSACASHTASAQTRECVRAGLP